MYWEGDLRNISYFFVNEKNLTSNLKSGRPLIFGERESAPNNRITDKLTVSTEKELKNQFQTEDTFNNKEDEGSAAENFKCV